MPQKPSKKSPKKSPKKDPKPQKAAEGATGDTELKDEATEGSDEEDGDTTSDPMMLMMTSLLDSQ